MIKRYAMRIRKWSRYATGASYQHMRQGEGRCFTPHKLSGYFNDLTHKAEWVGQFHQSGVPLVKTDTDPAFAFPIVIFQWALGNWDLWLLSGKQQPRHLDRFLCAAEWAVEHITKENGWLCWTGLERPVSSPYSSMAQGQGISVLVRAALITQDPRFSDVATRAATLLLEGEPHCLARSEGGSVILEEYPGGQLKAVLNGWIFSLVGLADFVAFTHGDELKKTCSLLCRDLVDNLHNYDTGFWSTYDLSGTLASPFYHDLHIHQLRAISKIFPEYSIELNDCADRFLEHQSSFFNKSKAISIKIIQKLKQTSTGEME